MSISLFYYSTIITITIFSSMVLATETSATLSWSGRVPSGEPINVTTDGKVVTFEAWSQTQVEELKDNPQFEITPVSKEVSILSIKL